MAARLALALSLLLTSWVVCADQRILLFEDSEGQQTIFDVSQNPQWFTETQQTARGVTDAVFWLKVRISNLSTEDSHRYVVFESNRLGSVVEFEKISEGFRQREHGADVPLNLRASFGTAISFPHNLEERQTGVVYYRISGQHAINLGYSVIDGEVAQRIEARGAAVDAGLTAVAITLLLFNLVIAFYLKAPIYWYLCAFLASTALLILSSTRLYELVGITTNQPALEMAARALLSVTAYILIECFFQRYSYSNSLIKRLRSLLIVAGVLYVTIIVPAAPSVAIRIYGAGGSILAVLAIGYLIINALRAGDKQAWVVLVGFVPLVIGSVSYTLYANAYLGPEAEPVIVGSVVLLGPLFSLLLAFKLKRADRTEELLAQTKFVAEKTGSAYWHLDLTANQMSYNSTFAHRWGLPEDQTLNFNDYIARLSPKVREVVEDAMERVVTSKRHTEQVFQTTQHGMKGRWLKLQLEPVADERGGVIGVVAASTDVTELKQAEINLERAVLDSDEARLRSDSARHAAQETLARLEAVSSAVDMVYWNYNVKSSTVAYGDRFAELHNLKPGGTLNWQEFGRLNLHEPRSLFAQMIMDVLKTGKECRKTHPGIQSGHRNRTYQTICLPDQVVQPISSVTFVTRDITDLMHSQRESERVAAELKRANHALQTLQEKRNQLFGMVAHELRTPVAAIMMMVNQSSDAELLERKSDILRSSRDLLNTIDDMRMLVNPDLKRPIRLETFTVEELNEQISTSVASIVSATGMQYLQHNALPIRSATQSFSSDSYRVRHAVANLIKNACLHSEGSRVSLISRIYQDGLGDEYLQWVVLDDGVGIPEAMVQRLFSAGERGHSKSDGSGFGLYIAKSWIEELGGSVNYLLRQGANLGSEFRVTVPLVRESAESPVEVASESEAQRLKQFSELKVLMVEDEAVLRMLGQKLVGQVVASVDVAENGAVGLERFSEAYDLVLTDYFMPQVNGPEMIKAMRAQGFKGPIIGVTAATIGEQRLDLLDAGADLVLNKPLTKESIIDAFEQLSQSGRLKQTEEQGNHRE